MVGIYLVLLLIYFIIRVIGIYKKEIICFFKRIISPIGIWIRRFAIKSLVERIDEMGFYKYADEQNISCLKKETIKSGFLYTDETKRIFMADAEDLAEGFIDHFYKKIEPFLLQEGVRIESFEQKNDGDKYEITVNNQTYLIYDDDLGDELWELATNRVFDVINILLIEAGSNERLYSLYGGNDLFALFLTEDMFKAINNSKWINTKEKPTIIPKQY